MGKRKIGKFIKNEYFFSIVTKFFTIAIGMVQSVLIARYLGAELKGVNAYISSITSIGAIIITFGMHQAYPYFRKQYGKDYIYNDFISLMILIFSVFFLVGIILLVIINLEFTLKIVLVLIPLLGYSRVVSYISLVERPNLRNAWWTVISVLDVLYVCFLWLFVQKSIYSAVSILCFADAIKCVVYTFSLKVRPKFHKGLLKLAIELFKYGIFPMFALLMTTLNYRIDVLMLHQYEYITDAMIGIYSLGLSLSDKIVLIPDTLKGILVSKLSKGASYEEVAKVSRYGFWTSLFICILIILFGKPIISILYGKEYIDSYMVIVITSFGILAVSYFKLIAQFNIVNKKQKLNVVMLSIAIVVDVVLNLTFIPIWGINGAAFATSIGNLVCGIVFIVYFSKISGISVLRMILIQKEDIQIFKAYVRGN